MAATSSIHMNMFGPHPMVVHGTTEQKDRWIPRLISGEDQVCFGVTEPDAGLDTTSIKTFAHKVDGGYLVSGRKMWISTAQVASKILLLARTSNKPDNGQGKATAGMSLLRRTAFIEDRDPCDSQAWPRSSRLQCPVHRRPLHSGRRFDRRGRTGLLLPP